VLWSLKKAEETESYLILWVAPTSGEETLRLIENSFRLMAFKTVFLFILLGEYRRISQHTMTTFCNFLVF